MRDVSEFGINGFVPRTGSERSFARAEYNDALADATAVMIDKACMETKVQSEPMKDGKMNSGVKGDLPNHGDLKVWWIPQVPGEPFEFPVKNLVEAKLLLDALAGYDQFQLETNIKPDYCNAGGLKFFDAHDDFDGPDGSWCEWCDENGNEIDDLDLDHLRALMCDSSLPGCAYQ